ncbi:MAG: outer membrane lipoprotein carrier protein LolA [Solirubrobacterales bacterium]
MNLLRRLPLSRLLLLCGLVVALGVSITALAVALSTGPIPPPKPLPEAVHDALAGADGHPIQGVSARIQFSNHLIEGASLASGGGAGSQLASSPLLTGASGRLWIAADGRTRLELQSENGDSQLLYDGHTVSLYDASSNTLYRYTPQQESGAGSAAAGSSGTTADSSSADATHHHAVPTAQEVQEAIAKAAPNATFSGATPTDVAGQPAYTVRISPARNGGLIGGAELSWDASNGVPLRAAIYSSTSSSPVIELAATEVSYGPVNSSVFDFTPPASAKVEEVTLPAKHESQPSDQGDHNGGSSSSAPTVTTHGEGLAAINVIEAQAKEGAKSSSSLPEGLPQVKINGTTATELATPLGTLLSFERNSVRYLLVGSVTPAAIEAFARGL